MAERARCRDLLAALSRARGLLLAYLVAIVALLVALWCAPLLPTHDGPKQLYSAHVRFHVSDPAFAPSFEPSYPITSVGFTILYGLLEKVWSWRIAYGLSWTLVVSVLPLAVWQLASAFDRRRAPLGLLGVAGAIHWSVHMGFANYVPSVGLGLLAVGLGVAKETWSLRRELAIYALLSATCLFHPVGAQLGAVGLFIFRALGTTRGRAIRELGAMALGCAPAAAITLITHDTLSDLLQKGMFRVSAEPLTLSQRVANFFGCFLSGPLWRSAPVVAAAAVGLVAGAIALARAARPGSRHRLDRRAAAVLVVVAGSLALALSTPLHSDSWEFMQPRFIPPAIFAAIALVPLEKLGAKMQTVATLAFCTCAVTSNAWVIEQHRLFSTRYHDAFAGLGAAHRAGRTLLPIVALPETGRTFQNDRSRAIPYASFIFNLGQIYAVDRNAVTPYSFSFMPNIHPIQFVPGRMGRTPRRDYGEFFEDGADPVAHERELVRLATFGVGFDDVLFYGHTDDVDRLIALGYRAETRAGGFMLGELIGCPIELTIDTELGAGSALVGWMPADRVVQTLDVGQPGRQSFRVEKGSCEAMWLRWVSADPEKPGACRGADETGTLLIAAGSTAARCEVVGAR